jgi:GT2 family glycosyltransferase
MTPTATDGGVARVVQTAAPQPIARFTWHDDPVVSVVIVAYGTGTVLDRCLMALARAADAESIAMDVLVVDNLHPRLGSWAGDRLCLLTEGVRLVRTTANLGFGGGNSAGIAAARAETVCLLNPDVMLAPGQLTRLLAEAGTKPDHIVAPGLLNEDGTVQELGRRILSNGLTEPIMSSGSHAPDYASAACWVLSRSLYDAVGGFDPIYHPAYYEDVDLVLRARDLGYGLTVVDDVRVVHTQHGSAGQRPDVERQKALFMERWRDLVRSRPNE